MSCDGCNARVNNQVLEVQETVQGGKSVPDETGLVDRVRK